MKRKNILISLGVVTAVVLGIALIPVPHTVRCSFEIMPRDAHSVYADTPGKLTQVSIKAGQEVVAGEPLATLESIDLELALAELEGKQAEYKAQLASLNIERFKDQRAGRQIPEVRKTLAMVEEQLAEKKQQAGRLTMIAPAAGVIIPPPSRPSRGSDTERLERWSGTPLDEKNRGAHMTEGELLCRIGNPRKLDALLVIDQTDIELVREKMFVKIKLEARPGSVYAGEIEEIARLDMKESPLSLSNKAGGDLATRTDADGVQRPMSTSYQARMPLPEDSEGRLQVGLRGQAKVFTGWQSLGRTFWRYLSQTFHFKL